ncbi:MAG: hypothetical protein JSR09_08770 [Bacteroidetes bacterium]|nr:hypothetical protein [Bacteroidota bacterium]MBS1649786.1 hypothetical protein [Bacteroidota bacterium]
MKKIIFLIVIFSCIKTNAQFKKIDTLVQIGKSGYRVYASNKSKEKNTVSIKLIGFDNDARDLDFLVDGKIKYVAIDDFNNDSYPDLLLFVYSGTDFLKVNIVGIASEENKSCVPIYFPDIRDDVKLRIGYNGHDVFDIIEGNLFRKFPIYNADNLNAPPTDSKRTIQYKMIKGEKGSYKFVVVRSYESK